MTNYEQARRMVIDKVAPAGVERVLLLDAAGRVLAEDYVAPKDMPRWDNSAMDGFAVRSADCAPGTVLKVTDYIPAGVSSDDVVTPGCAARIMTGAPIPPGADAVVPIEETENTAETVKLLQQVKKHDHIRFQGEDVRGGEAIMPRGTVIGAPQVSLMASFSTVLVPVYRKVRVAILSTGDELVEVGTEPKESQIVNSNTLALATAIKLCGAEPVILGIARDDRESHRALLSEGLKADVLVTSAGVSAGDRDLVREVLAELGVVEQFWKPGIKPGGPTAFGMKGNVPVFSLPGNPVSTMITFEEFARPAILRMMGHEKVFRRTVSGILKEGARKKAGKVNFLRVHVAIEGGRFVASTSGDQNTGILKTMLLCNALAILPAEATEFAAGAEVDLHLLDPTLEMEV
ncbi:molybdopterin molybdotransferase MoeA [Geomonas nitrogeniifigens]|uniref:Molybdopterin molybdenumtransferase n=1 Tax=Geomonas diazotrophica TaxID=2843197 RepID=A0ABX8JP71_9BACT|nr:gephyrin-like molybdotransferase Glp [Geomonas nitrogeniifigens]QWV99479.1 molybdopterin molybdotransferase MoeA [Geomonas nitrogeniifigens]